MKKQNSLTFERKSGRSSIFDRSRGWSGNERKLQPSRSGFEFFENIRERNPHNQTIVCSHGQVNHKILGRNWFEYEVQVVTGQSERLGACFGKLDVVAGRNGAADSMDRAFQGLVLE